MTTINIGTGKLIICPKDSRLAFEFQQNKEAFADEPDVPWLQKVVAEMETGQLMVAVVATDDQKAVIRSLSSFLTYIPAAGGVVENDDGETLFIFRRGKWDLPKGKLDEGEGIKECALREVEEETGLQHLTITDFVMNTWHVYHAFGQHVIKRSSWFKMHCPSGQTLRLQTEEDITDAVWLKRNDWNKVMKNTYLTIQDVLETMWEH